MNTYLVTPVGKGTPFELEAGDAIEAMALAAAQLGGASYSIQRINFTPALLFGTLTADGRVQL